MKDPDPLNVRPDDPLVKWRRESIRGEEARRAAKRELRQQEEQTAVEQLRGEMQQEITNLRVEVHQLHETALEATGTALGEFSNKTMDHVEKLIKQTTDQLWVTVERRFGELMGRLDAIASDARSRPKDFKFTNERDADSDPVDLPNPLPRRGLN
jgi:hypothetical protein